MYQVNLIVKPKPGVRDPQGDAVEGALRGMGYESLTVHCVGRYLNFDLDAPSEAAAHEIANDMCKRLLVNPNLETYELTISQVIRAG